MRLMRWVFRLLSRLVIALMLAVIDLLNRVGDLLVWLFVRPPANVPWRLVSGVERAWLAFNRLQPFVIQLVAEGRLEDGAELDSERLERALNRVVDSQPGTRVRLRGASSGLHWIADGPKPCLRVVSGKDWDGSSPEGAPFLVQPLDPVRGPVAEVLVIKGEPLRFVFRVLHAVTDAAGSMLFVQGFFSALRDEELTYVSAGPPIDAQVARKFCPSKPSPKEPPAPMLIKPLAEPTEDEAWARVHIAGHVEEAVARVGIALVESALAPIDKSLVRYVVPVDMRRLTKVPPSSANLVGMIRLELVGPLTSEDPVKALHRDIIATLARREFGEYPVSAYRFLRLISLKRLSRALRRVNSGTSTASATLSYMGGLKIEEFCAGEFRATSVFSIPPNVPFGRLFVGLVQTDAALEIVAHQPGSRCITVQLRELLDRVVAVMESRSVQSTAESFIADRLG